MMWWEKLPGWSGKCWPGKCWPGKWSDLSLPAKSTLLISIPATATVLLFGLTNVLSTRHATATGLVDLALETSQEIQRLDAAEAEMSADARGYFITGREPFLNRARSSLQSLESSRHKLLDLTADSPVEQQRMAHIASIEQAREERMFGGIARFRSGVFPMDQLRVELLRGEAERRRMEDVLKSMENDTAIQIGLLKNQVSRLRAVEGAVTGLGLFLGLAGGLALPLLFARGITSRIAFLQRNVTALAGGAAVERAVEQVDGRDEIGALNQGLIRMAESLRSRGANALDGRDGVDPATLRMNGHAKIAIRFQPPSNAAPAEHPVSSFSVFLRSLLTGQRGEAALIRAKDAALASNRARTEFLARISHDIRTPLNAILGAADLLSQTPLSFDQGEYVSMFQRNCRSLVALMNDFLDLSRIEAGALRVEKVPFCIPETVDDVVATFREYTVRKGIALGVEVDPAAPAWALGDPLRIQQVLVNLLSNALKFTSQGRVDVKVTVLRAISSGDQLRYEISDTGPGIRPEDQKKIFAQFVQLPNPGSVQRGAGLGLTICRDLVELMGGEIGVLSREGGGSTFHFSLPLEAVEPAPADAETVEHPAAHLSSGEPIRILVAEDTEDNQLLLEHYLRDQPVELRLARNGQEALDAIQQGEQFDLILMDIDMPVMDGYAATRRIRAWQLHSQSPETPIVAWSADAMREAVRASMDAGCVAHVAKPMDRETLLKTIRRFAPANRAQIPRTAPAIAVSMQVRALVPLYLASKEKQIEEARASLASRDFGPIRRFGHNLKGTGRGYGFPPMEALGREIERAASEADASCVTEQLNALHRFVSDSINALRDD
jgi:signal transduction histidine kinase/CheY-like chemotaxis protein/HPt (histidine-containing phosphotransfer) domain-containing protein